jgi:hypothetical protein
MIVMDVTTAANSVGTMDIIAHRATSAVDGWHERRPCAPTPADNRMGFAKRILEPTLPRQLAIICTNDIWLPWKDIQAGWLEKMHIQALLASIVMVSIAVCCSCISFSSLPSISYMI